VRESPSPVSAIACEAGVASVVYVRFDMTMLPSTGVNRIVTAIDAAGATVRGGHAAGDGERVCGVAGHDRRDRSRGIAGIRDR
jgi:hypothetical protein